MSKSDDVLLFITTYICKRGEENECIFIPNEAFFIIFFIHLGVKGGNSTENESEGEKKMFSVSLWSEYGERYQVITERILEQCYGNGISSWLISWLKFRKKNVRWITKNSFV